MQHKMDTAPVNEKLCTIRKDENVLNSLFLMLLKTKGDTGNCYHCCILLVFFEMFSPGG